MRAWSLTAISSVVLMLAAHGLAIVAVEVDAAGALLSPAGTLDPLAWLTAGGYAIARFGSVASFCAAIAFGAALLFARAQSFVIGYFGRRT